MNFYNKFLYSKDLEFTYHSKVKKKKVKNQSNNYYILNKNQSQL